MAHRSEDKVKYPKGPISWMARNPVAANLLMLIFIVGGALFASRVKQEIFPEFELDIINVSVVFPGATPEEVEQGIILVLEDEIRGLDGIKEVRSTAVEGRGVVNAELILGENPDKTLQRVKNVVDGVTSFPEDAEKPIVNLVDPRNNVISLVLYGDQEEKTLFNLAERVRDDLLRRDKITLVELSGVRPVEIAIEVPIATLREYNLTLEQIADLVGDTAVELGAGGIQAPGGEVLVRTDERRDYAHQFGDIHVMSNDDGSQIYLEDIADLVDGFSDVDLESSFNGQRAVKVDVFRVGDETPITISDEVHEYVAQLSKTLPEGISVAAWDDRAEVYRDRIHLLTRNAGLGLTLVLLLLGLFLEPRLAFWVTLGIPISIIGSFLFIPLTGASINMVSLFAFIVTLGIIVDDAVVVGEMVFQRREKGEGYLLAAIDGARDIAGPVVFAVLTNIAAFLPLFFVPGSTGKIFLQIPSVVVAVFVVSLVESLFILPSHLGHQRRKTAFWKIIGKPRTFVNKGLRRFIYGSYVPFLRLSLKNRYFTVSCGLCLLAFVLSLVVGGHIRFSYLPRVDSDLVRVQALMPFGVPMDEARRIQRTLVRAAQEVLQDTEGARISRGIYTVIGESIGGQGPAKEDAVGGGSHIVNAQLFLVPSDLRSISGLEFARLWRQKVGKLQGVDSVSFDATIGNQGGSAIDIQLSHESIDTLEEAAQELALALEGYEGAQDIDNGVKSGKPQLNLQLTAEGRSLGITVNDLARQVRSAFYGAEALRQQRGRNEVKVLLRLPEEERNTLYTIEEMIIRNREGIEIPLRQAATMEQGRAYSDIKRTDGRRVIAVTGDVDEQVANANEIIGHATTNVVPMLIQKYPGLTYSLEGQQREQRESLEALGVGFIFALMAIYTLMAIPFKSYVQPLIIMLNIPFGIVGAFIGHLLLGYELSIISMFGIIALAGVVVNDSLVLLVTTNKFHRKRGFSPRKSVRHAGVKRFRPILLTSLTTFFGLAPMIFETSMQARFLVPMAISLGFGILFATLIVLVLVPSAYCILEDLHDQFMGPR